MSLKKTPAAIIAAGGSGERARNATEEVPKQFRELAGRPLLAWSAAALAEAGCNPVIVVVPEGHVEEARSLLGDPFICAIGGPTRQSSVSNGLTQVETDRVIVHDGARPFVTPDLVIRVLEGLPDVDGAVAAIPVDDTVKRVDGDRVLHTVDRTQLWSVQTPQAFWTERLRVVHKRAEVDGIEATDDAALIETFGGTVRVVEGSRTNIKVTHPEDLAMAEHLASRLT
ncbi:MAG: 2-C-methyl-D-erythritol 4-phosphate cytidylyltransferase [Actinomycetota bacterium]